MVDCRLETLPGVDTVTAALLLANCVPRLLQRKTQEGKTKKQALVCVMRRLVNIVYGMMKHRTAYVMPELPEKEAA